MNANQTSPPDLLPPPESPEAAGTRARRSLADRILAWSFLASVVVNIAWVALVSHSNLFGGGVVPPTREHPVKVFKPIPVKPKPKKKELPPPPPPKQHKIQPPKPLKPLIHPPRPTPPRPQPHPQPQLHRMDVVTTHNNNAVSPLTVPETSPNTDVGKPTASGESAQPTPPAPAPPPPAPAPPPPAPPAPVYHAPPAPPAPVYHAPPPPPPPVYHPPPKPAIPDRDEPGVPASIDTFSLPDGTDTSTISNPNPTAEFDVDAQGHAHNIHISTGNPEVDRLLKEKIESTRFKPAVHNGVPEEGHATHAFSIG